MNSITYTVVPPMNRSIPNTTRSQTKPIRQVRGAPSSRRKSNPGKTYRTKDPEIEPNNAKMAPMDLIARDSPKAAPEIATVSSTKLMLLIIEESI